jgi:nucleotide-binding universal stress UspA family protein
MKTILVLTDFSINADHAAHYALKLAQRIGANLLLCNIYELPQGERIKDHKAWPLTACEQNSIRDLGELSARLKTEINKDKEGLFRPEVAQCSRPGAVIDNINDIASKNEVIMGVIGRHNAGWLSTLVSGDHTHDIIEAANFPVLLVPYQVMFDDYKSIAFATNMNYTDINVLGSLIELAKYMDPEIVVAKVTAAFSNKKFELNKLQQFFTQTPGKINYPKILYRILENRTVINSLIWLANNFAIDLLVVVHRRRNSLQKLFSGSTTQQLAVFLNKPMLIFPCYRSKRTLPAF